MLGAYLLLDSRNAHEHAFLGKHADKHVPRGSMSTRDPRCNPSLKFLCERDR